MASLKDIIEAYGIDEQNAAKGQQVLTQVAAKLIELEGEAQADANLKQMTASGKRQSAIDMAYERKLTALVSLLQLNAAETRRDFSKALDRLDSGLLGMHLDCVLSICQNFLRSKYRLDGMEGRVMNVMMLALVQSKNHPHLCDDHLQIAFDQNPYLKKIVAVIKRKLPKFELAFPGSLAYNRAVIHAQLKKQGANFDVVNELIAGRINWLDAVDYALDNKDTSLMARLMRLYVHLSDSDASLSHLSHAVAMRLLNKAKAMDLPETEMACLVSQLPSAVIRFELKLDVSHDIAGAAIQVLLKQINAGPALKKYSAQTISNPQQRHQLYQLMQHLSTCQSRADVDQVLGYFRRRHAGLVRSWSNKDLKGLGLCAGVPLYGAAALAYNVSKRAGAARAMVGGLLRRRQSHHTSLLPVEPVVMAAVADPALVKAAVAEGRVLPVAVPIVKVPAVEDSTLAKASRQAVAVHMNRSSREPVGAVVSALPVSIDPIKIKALKWLDMHLTKSSLVLSGVAQAKNATALKAQIAAWLPQLAKIQKTIRFVDVAPIDEAISFKDLQGLVVENVTRYRAALVRAEGGVRASIDDSAYSAVREQHLQAVSGAYAALLALSVATDKLMRREARPVSSATSMAAVGLHKKSVSKAAETTEREVVGVKVSVKKQPMFS